MSQNKIVFWITILASLVIIALPTTLKIVEHHQEKLYLVATKKIFESALDCFYEDVCSEDITIGELKNSGYLKEDVVNPKTKMFFSNDLVLVYENNQFQFKK